MRSMSCAKRYIWEDTLHLQHHVYVKEFTQLKDPLHAEIPSKMLVSLLVKVAVVYIVDRVAYPKTTDSNLTGVQTHTKLLLFNF